MSPKCKVNTTTRTRTTTTTKVAMMGTSNCGHISLSAQFISQPQSNRKIEFSRHLDIKGTSTKVELNVFVCEYDTIYQYCQNSHAFVLVYSPLDRQSFEKIQNFIECIQQYDHLSNAVVAIVENNTFLSVNDSNTLQVKTEEAHFLANNFGCLFFQIEADCQFQVEQLIASVLIENEKKSMLKSAVGSAKKSKRAIFKRILSYIKN